jgi:hypothetical protein
VCDKISHTLSRAALTRLLSLSLLGATLILNHLLLLRRRRWRAPTVSQLGGWLAAPYFGIFVGRHARTHYSKASSKRSRSSSLSVRCARSLLYTKLCAWLRLRQHRDTAEIICCGRSRLKCDSVDALKSN